MTEQRQAPGEAPRHLTMRRTAFIGVGAMAGAGIFALLLWELGKLIGRRSRFS